LDLELFLWHVLKEEMLSSRHSGLLGWGISYGLLVAQEITEIGRTFPSLKRYSILRSQYRAIQNLVASVAAYSVIHTLG
jgi:hypothetical protein